MKAIRDGWFSRKLWLTLLLIALATYALMGVHPAMISGREWCIFVGCVAGAYLYFQGSLDIHKLKMSAGPQGFVIDNTDKQEGNNERKVENP